MDSGRRTRSQVGGEPPSFLSQTPSHPSFSQGASPLSTGGHSKAGYRARRQVGLTQCLLEDSK